MGLINSVDKITRTLEQRERATTLKEKKQMENQEFLDDIKNSCKAYLYEKIMIDDNLYSILENIDEHVSIIAEQIKSMTITKKVNIAEKGTLDWVDKVVKQKKYYIIDDFVLENTIKEILYKELSNILKEQKLYKKAEVDKLTNTLKKELRTLLSIDDDVVGLFYQLSRHEMKDELISDIAKNEQEKKILNEIYYKTLDNIYKTEFKYEIMKCKEKERKAKQRYNKKYGGILLYGVLKALNTNTRKLKR